MPVIKPPTNGSKNFFSPYAMTQYHSSRLEQSRSVKICAPYIDGDYSSLDFVLYDEYNDSRIPFSQWTNLGPLFTETDIFDSGHNRQRPPSFSSSPSNKTDAVYDSDLFAWPYDQNASCDPSFSFSTDSGSTVSIVSCSPRSDHTGLSLSPQPQFQEYANAFSFDFTTSLPHEFPSASTFSPDHLRVTPSPEPSSKSHSPTPSCSSLDPTDIKSSPSRGSSPLCNESDLQQHRRRFPCLIIGCERRFTSQYTLKVHMEAHKPKPRSSFLCTLGCAEKFSRQHDRLRHEVAKHGKICEFSCDDCGRFFSTRKTLGNHKCPSAHGGTRWVTN